MILVALGLFLVWEIVTRGVAAYLAEASPEKALALRPTQPTALLKLAERTLRRDLAPKKVEPVTNPPSEASPNTVPRHAQSQVSLGSGAVQNPPSIPVDDSQPQPRAEVRSLAQRALVNDPLNARALRILGQLAAQTSDDKQAETFMHAAVRRSLFESEAVYWVMQRNYETKNYPAALRYADTLLRTRQNVLGYVMPTLGKIAESRDGAGELRQVLASNPVWREGFFSDLSGNISDARTPLGIFLSLKDTAAPPTAAELRRYLYFLLDRKFYDLAYYTWLQFLSNEQLNRVGNLFNGSFEMVPSGLPFDWVWTDKPGATIQISIRPDQEGEHALHIAFGPGRVDFSGITQMITLPPGSYQFRGKYKVDLISQRGIQWRIACAGVNGPPLGENSIVTGRGEWKDFEFSFNVPNADCPAQYVTLFSGARSASEQFISGTIWYDDLKIVSESVIAPSRESVEPSAR